MARPLTEKFTREAKRQFYSRCTNVQFNFMKALSRGDVQAVKDTLELFPEAVRWRGGKGREGDYLDNHPLQIAVFAGQVRKSAELIDLLVAQGADVNAQDGRGNTALHRAAHRLDIAAMAALLRHGADPSIKNNGGETARDAAKAGCKFMDEEHKYYDLIDREALAYSLQYAASNLRSCIEGTPRPVAVRNRPLQVKQKP
ncbi:MAG: ankyrin repeat domain-containing protein [Alphaproteobacteria bacterium]